MSANADPSTTARWMLNGTPVAQLLDMLTRVEQARDSEPRGSDAWKYQQQVWLWIADEIEDRYPATNPAMNAWADDDTDGRSYTAALVAAVREIIG